MQVSLTKNVSSGINFFLMRSSVATSDTSFFLMQFNFENCFEKLMTGFAGICFQHLLLLALILCLVWNENKQPLKKETPTQVFSCEIRKVSKNTFSYRSPSVAASPNNFAVEIIIYKPYEEKIMSFQNYFLHFQIHTLSIEE